MLLTAGTIEFGLRGFAATQTSAIARRAGVSQPNVYANFASKYELFLTCLRTVAERVPEGRSEAPIGIKDTEAMLIYQAIACAAAGDAHAREVRAVVSQIEKRLGSQRFRQTVNHAASLLLTHEAESSLPE